MLDHQDVFEAARAAITVVDDAREDVPLRGVRSHYYTLDGAVAEVLFRRLDMPFERAVRQAVGRARDEEINIRLGNLDPRDLEDGEGCDNKSGQSRVEKLERVLTHALAELEELRTHQCYFGEDDHCNTCGLDGRA